MIPLYRDGQIVGYAHVDPEWVPRLAQWRWHLNAGYATRYEYPRAIQMHRVILGDAPFDDAETDHINRDRLDNRLDNLRWVTHAQNMQNKPVYKNSTSGHRGVVFDRRAQRWYGQVKVGGRRAWIRYFNTKEEAAIGTAAARQQLQPYATT